jgi:hypothetical protein
MPTSLGGVPVAINYGSRDYEAFRADMLALAPLLSPEWTDQSPGDIGVVLTELFAYMGDVLSFHAERCRAETWVGTAVQRESMIQLARLVGYELRPATSSLVSLSFTCSGAGVIPARTQVATVPRSASERPQVFETLQEVTVLGAGVVSVDAMFGTSIQDEILGSGTGRPGQTLTLSSAPLSIDPSGHPSLGLYVDEGAGLVLWQNVQRWDDSTPASRHYRFEIDADDTVRIIFGDGVRGRLSPVGADNIRATYRTGGGAISNAAAPNSVTRLTNALDFVTSVTNPFPPQGGADKESVDEARVSIPASVESLQRAVTYRDFEHHAQQVAGIAQARAVRGRGPYEVMVYVAASGEDPIVAGTWNPRTETGAGLLGAVGSYLASRKIDPLRLDVRNFNVVDLEIRVSLLVEAGHFQADVESGFRQIVLSSVAAMRLGEPVLLDTLSKLAVVPGLRGVRWLAFRKVPSARLVVPDPVTALNPPDASWTIQPLNVGDDYGAFAVGTDLQASPEERWSIRFVTAATYRVVGSISGRQSTMGTVGVTWTADEGNLSLLVENGAVPLHAGVRYEITVGSGQLNSQIDVVGFEAFRLTDSNISVASFSGGIPS